MTDTATPQGALSIIPSQQSDGTDLAVVEQRLAAWDAKRQLVLRVLNATDVARMGGRLAKNRYAAEKLLGIFGGRLELLKDPDGRPVIEKTMIDDDPDMGRIVIFTTFSRYTRPDGLVFEAAGSFSTKDPFFAMDQGAYKPFSEINLADILSASFTESAKKAIFRGCGLGDFAEGEQTQVLAEQAQGHAFTGSKKITDSDPTISWGNSKGKKVSELTLKDALYYLPKYEQSVADPDKAKWAKSNKTLVEALTAHVARLKAPTAAEDKGPAAEGGPAEGGAPDTDTAAEGPAEMPATRGGKIAACFAILEKHAGKTGKGQAALIKAITGAWGIDPPLSVLSNLSDDQLRAILEMTDVQIETIKANAL